MRWRWEGVGGWRGIYACVVFSCAKSIFLWNEGGGGEECITKQMVRRGRGRVIEKCSFLDTWL